jgi:hypothetical protein
VTTSLAICLIERTLISQFPLLHIRQSRLKQCKTMKNHVTLSGRATGQELSPPSLLPSRSPLPASVADHQAMGQAAQDRRRLSGNLVLLFQQQFLSDSFNFLGVGWPEFVRLESAGATVLPNGLRDNDKNPLYLNSNRPHCYHHLTLSPRSPSLRQPPPPPPPPSPSPPL